MKNKIIILTITILASLLIGPKLYPAESNKEAEPYTSNTTKGSASYIIEYSNGIISISSKDTPLIELFTALTEKTDIKFIYDKNILADKKITIELTKLPLQDAIKEILKKCEIKNYTTKLGEDPSKPIEQIEILSAPTPSSSIEVPYIEKQEPFYPEIEVEESEIIPEEEKIEDKGTEYKPPEYKPPEENTTPQKETEIEEGTEEETQTTQTIGSRTYTYPSQPSTTTQPVIQRKKTTTSSTEIKDMSDQYYPPGSENTKKEPQTPAYNEGPIPDMSDQYYPPGSENTKKEPQTPAYNEGPIPDMSDQYRPPGS